jgi:hypothetical protein
MGRNIPPLQKIEITQWTSPPPPRKRGDVKNKVEDTTPSKSPDLMDYLLPAIFIGSLFGGDE